MSALNYNTRQLFIWMGDSCEKTVRVCAELQHKTIVCMGCETALSDLTCTR